MAVCGIRGRLLRRASTCRKPKQETDTEEQMQSGTAVRTS